MFRLGLPLVVLWCFATLRGSCQETYRIFPVEDSIRSFVAKVTGTDLQFVNGTLYQDSYPRTNGHPFYGSGNWVEGSVVMSGSSYEGLLLKYDILKDQLVYNHLSEMGVYALNLNKDLIEGFSLDERHFIRLNPQDQAVSPGFYETIASGSATCYVKWVKKYEKSSVTSPGSFTQIRYSYIQNHHRFFRVKGRHGLIKALEDQQKTIRKYIRENGLVIRGENETAIQRVVEYYNSLKR